MCISARSIYSSKSLHPCQPHLPVKHPLRPVSLVRVADELLRTEHAFLHPLLPASPLAQVKRQQPPTLMMTSVLASSFPVKLSLVHLSRRTRSRFLNQHHTFRSLRQTPSDPLQLTFESFFQLGPEDEEEQEEEEGDVLWYSRRVEPSGLSLLRGSLRTATHAPAHSSHYLVAQTQVQTAG